MAEIPGVFSVELGNWCSCHHTSLTMRKPRTTLLRREELSRGSSPSHWGLERVERAVWSSSNTSHGGLVHVKVKGQGLKVILAFA